VPDKLAKKRGQGAKKWGPSKTERLKFWGPRVGDGKGRTAGTGRVKKFQKWEGGKEENVILKRAGVCDKEENTRDL